MITGVDYVIYTTISIFDIIDTFKYRIRERWTTFIVEEFDVEKDKRLELFFARDKAMNRFHDENGYTLDANGEGCFMILCEMRKNMNLDIFVKEQVHGLNGSPTMAYDSMLIGNNLWEYSIVLPDVVEDSAFCMFIMDSLISSIKYSMESQQKSGL